MPSPVSPNRSPAGTPHRRVRDMDGARTPAREEVPLTPTSRTPRRPATTPRREVSPAKSTTSSVRTPRKTQATPAKSVSTVDTPMRWGGHRSDASGQREIPPSPAHSLDPTSPGTGYFIYSC